MVVVYNVTVYPPKVPFGGWMDGGPIAVIDGPNMRPSAIGQMTIKAKWYDQLFSSPFTIFKSLIHGITPSVHSLQIMRDMNRGSNKL